MQISTKHLNTMLKAIKTYGKTAQVLVAVEELAELQKELLKNINRGKSNRTEIVDEMADVQIMIDQLKIVFAVEEDEINKAIERKVDRLERALNKS